MYRWYIMLVFITKSRANSRIMPQVKIKERKVVFDYTIMLWLRDLKVSNMRRCTKLLYANYSLKILNPIIRRSYKEDKSASENY